MSLEFGNQCENDWSSILGSDQLEKLTLADLAKIDTFGAGAFGSVDLVCSDNGDDGKQTNFALKIVPKPKSTTQKPRDRINREKELMALARQSQFVVKMLRAFQDAENVFFLMEPCLGGDLRDLLSRQGPLGTEDAQFCTACVVEALDYLHSYSIIHGDVKSANVVMDARGYLKLTDFGLSERLLFPGSKSRSLAGTKEYMPPEIFMGKGHDTSADYWALGVLLHEMLTGTWLCKVNYDTKGREIGENIIKSISEVKYPWYIDDCAVELVKALCSIVPNERIGYRNGNEEIREHQWFEEFQWAALKEGMLASPITPQLKFQGKIGEGSGCYSGKPCSPENYWPEFS